MIFGPFVVFLVRGHFISLFLRLPNIKGYVPLGGKCIFFVRFDCYHRQGTLFCSFLGSIQWKKNDICEECVFHVCFDCFSRQGMTVLNISKSYHSEDSCLFFVLNVFLVAVRFVYSFLSKIRQWYSYEESAFSLFVLIVSA